MAQSTNRFQGTLVQLKYENLDDQTGPSQSLGGHNLNQQNPPKRAKSPRKDLGGSQKVLPISGIHSDKDDMLDLVNKV